MASPDDLPVELHWPGTTPDPESPARPEQGPGDVDPDASTTVDDEVDTVVWSGTDPADPLLGESAGVVVPEDRSDRSEAPSTISGEPKLRLRLRLRSPEVGGLSGDARAELLGRLERQAADLTRRIEALRR